MKKKFEFITQDYPIIVKLFGSLNPLQVGLYLTPLFLLLSSCLIINQFNTLTVIGSFAFGVLYWTFLEYAIHRYAYHGKLVYKKFRYTIGSFHLYHHQNMSDLRVLNAGVLIIYPLTVIFLLPIYILSKNWIVVSSVGLGLMITYLFYECVHYFIHYRKYSSGYMNYIQKYHFHHHDRSPTKNFGNTSHLWDYLLGTYDEKYKGYQMSDSTYQTLITSQQKIELMPEASNV